MAPPIDEMLFVEPNISSCGVPTPGANLSIIQIDKEIWHRKGAYDGSVGI
jgi:hypothetical protein